MIRNVIFALGNVLISFRPSDYLEKNNYPEPQECLFIDDLEINVKTAETIGFRWPGSELTARDCDQNSTFKLNEGKIGNKVICHISCIPYVLRASINQGLSFE
jgi:hypothetical protein